MLDSGAGARVDDLSDLWETPAKERATAPPHEAALIILISSLSLNSPEDLHG
jgi:hypothetical protein